MADDELYPSPDDYKMKASTTYTPPKVWHWDQEGEDNRAINFRKSVVFPFLIPVPNFRRGVRF